MAPECHQGLLLRSCPKKGTLALSRLGDPLGGQLGPGATKLARVALIR